MFLCRMILRKDWRIGRMRLIDADEFKKQIVGMAIINNYKPDKANTLCELIDAQPTAYDIDKVVKEIEANGKNTDVCISKIRAIEIVKQGVYYDVCEWKSASDGEFIQNPHTKRLYSNEPSMKNIYCNTCGKKIKVVE